MRMSMVTGAYRFLLYPTAVKWYNVKVQERIPIS